MTRPLLSLDLRALSRGDTPILGNITLALAPGDTLALVGPSGIGKTSLLRAIAGLDPVSDGTVSVAGSVAMVFQEPTLLPWRTALQNITLTTGVPISEAETWLAEVGLAGRGDAYPNQLSLGQQRRLSLARAFAMKPDLMLLDEPFVSLDPDLVAEMMALFQQLRAAHGVATILVTHVEDEARALASRIVTLGGTPATITSDRAL